MATIATVWPWLAVAAAGALHGLNPATGWPFAAAQGWRALKPIALGHTASIALVAATVAFAPAAPGRVALQIGALALLLALGFSHALHRPAPRKRKTRVSAGVALWSFTMSTAHGAGLMLVPALIPLCGGDAPGRELTASGSVATALAVVGVHTAAMLITTFVVATAVCRGVAAVARRAGRESPTMARCEPRAAPPRPVFPPPTSAPRSACSPPV